MLFLLICWLRRWGINAMIYNNSRRSIFENYEELRKPEKNTQPQLSVNYQTASSIILADSTWKTSRKASQCKTKLNSKLLDKRLCAHNLFLIDVLFLPFFFYCIFFQYHTFFKRNNFEFVTTVGQKEHWEPTSY